MKVSDKMLNKVFKKLDPETVSIEKVGRWMVRIKPLRKYLNDVYQILRNRLQTYAEQTGFKEKVMEGTKVTRAKVVKYSFDVKKLKKFLLTRFSRRTVEKIIVKEYTEKVNEEALEAYMEKGEMEKDEIMEYVIDKSYDQINVSKYRKTRK